MKNKSLVAVLGMATLATALSLGSAFPSLGFNSLATATPKLEFWKSLTFNDGTGPFAWADTILGSPSTTKIDSPITCPDTAEGAAVFIAKAGDENAPNNWIAQTGAAMNSSFQVVNPNVKLSGLTVGTVSVVKQVGGEYILGVACLENGGGFVDYELTRTITVEPRTGNWHASDAGSTSTPTTTSTATPTATIGSSDEKFYTFVSGQYVAENTSGTPFTYQTRVVGSPSKTDSNQPFTCPTSATGAYSFVSNLGAERVKSTWLASQQLVFDQTIQSISKPTIQLSSFGSDGSVLKATGGTFSLGVACTESSGTAVDYVSFRQIQITATSGDWTAGAELGGTITPRATPTPTATSSPTATATPTASETPTATPTPPAEIVPVQRPSWLTNAAFYQVDIRQATAAGTLAAFQNSQMSRLKLLGFKVLVLNPMSPISGTRHAGRDGSEYATDDYHFVNSAFLTSGGTELEFIDFVYRAHLSGIKVIVGWNAQAAGLDNVWLTNHKDWFRFDGQSNPMNPNNGYGLELDKVLFNYDNPDLRAAMASEMSYWVKHFGVDGFNCANVSNVPTGYWERLTAEVNKASTAKLLWLADTFDTPNFVNAFHIGYNYSLFEKINTIPSGKALSTVLLPSIASAATTSPNTFKLNFTNNNIFSSTIGSDVTRLGAATKTGAVIAFTAPGIPMIYNGQESGVSAKLDLNSKNYPFKWSTGTTAAAYSKFYANLMSLRKNNSALGLDSNAITSLKSNSKSLVAYVRALGTNKVIVIANMTSKKITASVTTQGFSGTFFDLDSNKKMKVGKVLTVSLPKFGYVVLSNNAAR